MNRDFSELAKPKIVPPLDPGFRPAVLANQAFRHEVEQSKDSVNLEIAIERADGTVSRYATKVFNGSNQKAKMNFDYVERLVKFLLWQQGGYRLYIAGPSEIIEELKATYSPEGKRAFDHNFMGKQTSEKPFEIIECTKDQLPKEVVSSMPIGRHLDGCRIGFDLGASDRKVAASIDGESVFSEEVVWSPRDATDPQYHFDEIMAGLKRAAEHLPRVDAIGGSSAGVILNNKPMVASLFRGIPEDLFESKIKPLFINIGKAWGVPIEVANDGDVTALAGAMSLNVNSVLGVAMGSSEAVGYVNAEGNITGWLNELAFAPIDYSPEAALDEWSGDVGCGALYLTQQAVFRLAKVVGIPIDESTTLAERLKSVQKLLEADDARAIQIWETIGVYMGYAISHYAQFYPIAHMLVLGRVTSGKGGDIVVQKAVEVLQAEFPDLAKSIELHLPDEAMRRVGQAIAAASLPVVGK